MENKEEEKIAYMARIPRHVVKRVKIYAVNEGKKMQDILVEAFLEYLEKREGK